MIPRQQEEIQTAYNAEGLVTSRTFKIGSMETRIQNLTWDYAGRLIRVEETQHARVSIAGDVAKGYVWEAWYDALGRRIQTEITQKLAGTLVPGTTQQERSWYDPLHEFLEVAVERWSNSATSSVVTRQERVWKVHGPDSSGRYGGHNGIGGMEALLDDHTGQWTALVEDFYGNIAGQIEQTSTTSTTIAWQTTQCTGYGPAPGSLTTTYTGFVVGSLAESTAWRGRRMDVTGFYYLGARYYEPGSGRFLSPDPAGHAASMSLYDYAGGDPVNFLDPDGRLDKKQSLWDTSRFFGQFGNIAKGLWDYGNDAAGGVFELLSGGYLYPGSMERFNVKTLGAVAGTLGQGEIIAHSIVRLLGGTGDPLQEFENILRTFGETPDVALANTIVAGLPFLSKLAPKGSVVSRIATSELTLTVDDFIDQASAIQKSSRIAQE